MIFTLVDLLYLSVALLLLMVVNILFMREESVFLKLKEHSYLPAFDFSIILIVDLFILQILPLKVLKLVWLALSVLGLYYATMKLYKLNWKEAASFYGIWLTFFVLLAFFLTKMANA